MKTAAAVTRDDICSKAFDIDVYATSATAFTDMSIVPETLRTFTHEMITKQKKGNTADKTQKCTGVNHAIFAATRPRSFLSVIQVGLPVYARRHLASV